MLPSAPWNHPTVLAKSADAVVRFSHAMIASADAIGKIELYDLPVLGKLLDLYGLIWLHRGQADIRAVRAALAGFRQ